MELATMLELLGSGLVLTLQVFVTTLVGALPLGVVVALCRMSRFKPLALITRFYISVMRGTPLMLQLMALMFGPYYLFGLQMGPDWKYWACSIGFIINYAAYFGEIYRSGLQSIPRGQYEAAEVLGYTRAQTFMKIILPQVAKRILPAMSNEVITLVKDTSLSRIIALQEIIWAGQAFLKGTQGISGAIWPLFFTGIYYLIFSGLLTLALGKLEKKLDYFKA